MKSYEELTDQEKVDLTDEQFQHYCDLVCAEAGAPLRPIAPGPKPAKYQLEPSTTAYIVGDNYYVNQEDAARVVELINSCPRYEWSYWSGPSYRKYIKGITSNAVAGNAEKMLTAAEREIHQKAIAEADAAIKEWETDESQYQKDESARDKALEWITDDRADARCRVNQLNRAIEKFQDYLSLADGVVNIALKFYIKACGNPPDGFYEKAGIKPADVPPAKVETAETQEEAND